MKYDITDQSASNSLLVPEAMTYVKLPQDSKVTSLYILRPPGIPKKPTRPRRGRPRKKATLEAVKEPELTQRELKSGTFKIARGGDCICIEDYQELAAHSQGSYRLGTYKLLDFAIWQLDTANRLPDWRRVYDPNLQTTDSSLGFLHPLLRL